ncbi:MAG: helix-turn-helix domain-containing protein [Gammaproteobacteria bacterium]|nr:helix-turn-helix domain-containing protein [Gammaproteobacteria bacterium]
MKHFSPSKPPEWEQDFQRNPDLGYEPEGSFHTIRCLEHGAPNPLIRWHYHEEYELHLIVKTSGKLFVGDYIGQFKPGNLVITGPRLPHNWISTDMLEPGVEIRDRVILFPDKPIRHASKVLPELGETMPLLDRARYGVEFYGMGELAGKYMDRIKGSTGLIRFSIFLQLLSTLAVHQDYQLLSSRQLQSYDDDASLQQISEVVDFVTGNYSSQFTMADLARRWKMTESQFSRYFRRATGNTFTNFVNRIRINKACQMLMESDRYISTICFEVGFNNVANFNRRFMEIKGMTPSNYRRLSCSRFD